MLHWMTAWVLDEMRCEVCIQLIPFLHGMDALWEVLRKQHNESVMAVVTDLQYQAIH